MNRLLCNLQCSQAGTLRDYQVGLQWMLYYNNKVNGILADEMDLIKPLWEMLFCLDDGFKRSYRPHLIIGPNSVMVNWKSELSNWSLSACCILFVGSKDMASKFFSQVHERSLMFL